MHRNTLWSEVSPPHRPGGRCARDTSLRRMLRKLGSLRRAAIKGNVGRGMPTSQDNENSRKKWWKEYFSSSLPADGIWKRSYIPWSRSCHVLGECSNPCSWLAGAHNGPHIRDVTRSVNTTTYFQRQQPNPIFTGMIELLSHRQR